MRTFSITLHDKNRNCSITYTAEEFKFCDGKLWLYHRELGDIRIKIEPDEDLTITQDRYEDLTITQDREEEEE